MNEVAPPVSLEGLPALVQRAGQRLLDAHNSAEVLEAKQLAEAALHYAKVTKAANDTHADCLRIITRAEMRMADEIDKGQASGEVARNDGSVNQWVSDHRTPTMHLESDATWPAGFREAAEGKATFRDLGLDRRRVAEWREVRDAGPEVVETAIQTALEEGRAPTKADITKHVRGTFGTGDNEWFTPAEHIERARRVLHGFDVDPASNPLAQETVKAGAFFTVEDDGLSKEWHGRVWLNPPYAQPAIGHFIDKLVEEIEAGRTTEAIVLTHNYTDTAWFQKAARAAAAVCFTRGRVKFVSPSGAIAAPTQGQAFFYFGSRLRAFSDVFGEVGFVATIPRIHFMAGEEAA